MSSAGVEALHRNAGDAPLAFLGASCVAWSDGRPGSALAWEPVDGAMAGAMRLLSLAADQALVGGRASRKPKPLAILLSGAVARPFSVGPVAGLRRWSEAQLIARSLAPQLTGLTAPCEVWMDDSPVARPVLAVAMEAALLQALHERAKAHGLRLVSLRPWWSLALSQLEDQEPQAPRLLAIDDGDALTLLLRSNDGPEVAWEPATCWPRPGPRHTASMLRRRAASGDLPVDACWHVDRAPPQGSAEAPDGDPSQAFCTLRFRTVDALSKDAE